MTKPTLGRVVIYTARGSADGRFKPEDRAAIITRVDENPFRDMDPEPMSEQYEEDRHLVDIVVLNPQGIFFDSNVTFSPEAKPGCWSWPVRVA